MAGGVFNPLAGLEVQKGNHQAPSIKPSFDPCPTFRQLFYKNRKVSQMLCFQLDSGSARDSLKKFLVQTPSSQDEAVRVGH